MDSVNVPEQLLQHLLGQTNSSAIQREQIVAAVRQWLMTAEPMPAGAMKAAAAAAIQPAIDCAPQSSEDSKAAFIAEFSSIDAKRRLKQELELRTQYPEENLKEFIYTIAAYDWIGGEVSESEKVDRVLQQMHPQLQDLVEGKQFANLAELAKAADGLMELALSLRDMQRYHEAIELLNSALEVFQGMKMGSTAQWKPSQAVSYRVSVVTPRGVCEWVRHRNHVVHALDSDDFVITDADCRAEAPSSHWLLIKPPSKAAGIPQRQRRAPNRYGT
ncbi:hypothetical protein HPB50_014117 [Hyalomma asiaticum]|uniref:Uncharacterized protein n=1 Tax=Hyalomma asiaticum TaxID=266040 RepID=A0ACB7S3S8_HYAAI|nr:hypothetical protein HPB50_014117 [Hyalomma asiaticum]